VNTGSSFLLQREYSTWLQVLKGHTSNMIEATLNWLSWFSGGPSDAGSALRPMPQYARWSTQVNELVLGAAHLQGVTVGGQAMVKDHECLVE
jgi:hypothetical protein